MPEFPFDAVVDYEKIAESCDWMCLPEYFREALPEFVRQLEAGGYVIARKVGTEYGWRYDDIGPFAVREGAEAAIREVDHIRRHQAASGVDVNAALLSRPILDVPWQVEPRGEGI